MRNLVCGLWTVLLNPALCLALDLTPTPSFTELEGVQIPQTTFRDGSRKVLWSAPWPISGGGAKITLYPPEPPQAFMKLEVRLLKAEDVPPGLPPAPEALQSWILPYIPADSTEVVPVAAARGGYQLQGAPSVEFTFTYLSQSRRFSTAVSYVDLNEKERLYVIVTAPLSSFAKIHQTAISSMFRMSWSK